MDDVRITTLANDISALLDMSKTRASNSTCDKASVSKSTDLVRVAKKSIASEVSAMAAGRVTFFFFGTCAAVCVIIYGLTDGLANMAFAARFASITVLIMVTAGMVFHQNEVHLKHIGSRIVALYEPAEAQCTQPSTDGNGSLLANIDNKPATVKKTSGSAETTAEMLARSKASRAAAEMLARSGVARTDTVTTTVKIARLVDTLAALTGMSYYREMDDSDIDGVVRRLVAPALTEARRAYKAHRVPTSLLRPAGQAGAQGAECEVGCGDRVKQLTDAAKKKSVADVAAAWRDCDGHMREMCRDMDDAGTRCTLGCNDANNTEVNVFRIVDSAPDTTVAGAWEPAPATVVTAVDIADHVRANKKYDAGLQYQDAGGKAGGTLLHLAGGATQPFKPSPGTTGTLVKTADSLLDVPEADAAAVAKGVLRQMMALKSVFDLTPHHDAVMAALRGEKDAMEPADQAWYDNAVSALEGASREAAASMRTSGKMPDITVYESQLGGMTLREFVSNVAHPVITGLFHLEARHACVTQTVSNFPYITVAQYGSLALLVVVSAALAYSLARPLFLDSEHRRSFDAVCILFLAMAVIMALVWMKRTRRAMVQSRGVKDANGRTLLESGRDLRAQIISMTFQIPADDCSKKLAGVIFGDCPGATESTDFAIANMQVSALLKQMPTPEAANALGCFSAEARDRLLALLVDTHEAVDACNFVAVRNPPAILRVGDMLFYIIILCVSLVMLERLFSVVDVRGTVLDIREANTLRRAVLDGEGPSAARRLSKFLETRQLQTMDYGQLVSMGFAVTAALITLLICLLLSEYNNADREPVATCPVKTRRS
jgi:hypothetical protein